MGTVQYRVTIRHREKGAGFSAREALRSRRNNTGSPITNVSFDGEPTGTTTRLLVTIDDKPLQRIIQDAVEHSGRMPSMNGLYSVEQVELLGSDTTSRNDLEKLRERYSNALDELRTAREQNAVLHRQMREHSRAPSPLTDILAYFETTDYKPAGLFDNPLDRELARKYFLSGNICTFYEYIKKAVGRELAEKIRNERSLCRALERSTARVAELEPKYQEAIEIPGSDTDEHAKVASDLALALLGFEKTIDDYEEWKSRQTELENLLTQRRELKRKYDDFMDGIDLLAQEEREIPALIRGCQTGIEIYFPFHAKDIGLGLVTELQHDLLQFFDPYNIAVLPGTFVAYAIHRLGNTQQRVDRFIKKSLPTLRLEGFHRIVPYRLEV